MLSIFALNFNLRPFTVEHPYGAFAGAWRDVVERMQVRDRPNMVFVASAGRCKLKPFETRVESACSHRLIVTCDNTLSNFAFDFILRLYTLDDAGALPAIAAMTSSGRAVQVDAGFTPGLTQADPL